MISRKDESLLQLTEHRRDFGEIPESRFFFYISFTLFSQNMSFIKKNMSFIKKLLHCIGWRIIMDL